MLPRLAFLLATIPLLVPVSVDAQLAPAPGDRVRITQVDGSVHTGVLRGSSSSDLQILEDDRERALIIPAAEVAGLERSLGKQGSFGKTLVSTVAIGAGVGLLVVGPFLPFDESCILCSPGSRGAAMVQGMTVIGLAAVPVGILLGAARKSERWAPAPWGGEASVLPGVRVEPDGVVQLSIRFPLGGGS
jgi:hypothetical protein